jgi:hypothetical protein
VLVGSWSCDWGIGRFQPKGRIFIGSHSLPPSLVARIGPSCMWALIVSFSPSWTKLLISQDSTLFRLGPWSLSSSRVRSLGFWESSLLRYMTCTGLQGLVKVLDELIPEVLLSTSKPYINTKLQNQHARMNLLYQGG